MKKYWFIISFLTLFVFSGLAYQLPCDFSLDIGEDINTCGAEFVQMEAIVSDVPMDIQWEPALLFSNANVINPVAAISETTTLSVTVSFLSDVNLVVNGDFELGDQGFTSDYIYGTGGGVGLLSNEGQYAIADNAGDTHNHFDDCTDHTGNGNMMVVNASGLPNSVWCQTITVMPNTEYEFGAWLTSVTNENPAQLQFSINGSALGEVLTASSTTCFWEEYMATWMSDAATTAEICINNVNLTPNGNDFAIDDISFKTICVLEDELTVNVGHADATWFAVINLCEHTAFVRLDELLDENATPGGTWTLNGQVVDGSESILLDVGVNEISYFVTDGICDDEVVQNIEVSMEQSTGIPDDPLVVCEEDLGILNLFDLVDGADGGGSWSQSSGPSVGVGSLNNLTGDLNMSNAITGIYEFTYEFGTGIECSGMPSTVVIEVSSMPNADAGADKIITCVDSSVLLGGEATSTGLNFVYQWVDLATMVVVNQEALLEVSEPGTYELQVENTQTGCVSKDKVTVTSDVHALSVAGHGEALGCANESNGQIVIDGIAGGVPPYLVSLDGGDFIETTLLSDLSAGDYHLTVMDVTGCTGGVDVSIVYQNELIVVIDNSQHLEKPSIALGDSILLTVQTSLSEDKIVSVQWLPLVPNCDGCFSTFVRPTSTGGVTYTAIVVDEEGCSTSANITILVNEVVDVFVPNAFSPNDDGVNDIFYVNTGAAVAEVELFQVVNRWGEMVFSENHILPNSSDGGWDGLDGGRPQPAGVYVYNIKLKLINGESIIRSGEVVLLR